MASHPILLVNSGNRDRFRGGLDSNGVQQVEKAGNKIAELLGNNLVIISATDSPTAQSGDKIAKITGGKIIKTEKVDRPSDNTELIKDDLEGFLENVLSQAGVSVGEGVGIVFVTHSPTIAAAKGHDQIDLAYHGVVRPGEVVAYDAAVWHPRQVA